ncbi:hypothetical protein FRC03_012613 [Tulasnella sp. 419]|nr:hypothetical protein FRC02_002145 [Tulasnella sp. 418]KAG8966037.1 hypothetical protein FRC03_012613 [Tulasnella sp. 419]
MDSDKTQGQSSSQAATSGSEIVDSIPGSYMDLKFNKWYTVPGILAVTSAYAIGASAGLRLTYTNTVVSHYIDYLLHASSFKNVPQDRLILIPGLWYTFVTFIFSAAIAVLGQAISQAGYRNRAPRTAKTMLTGLPYRMNACHQNLLETFPAFGFTVGIAVVFVDRASPLVRDQVVRLVTLHALLKTFVYLPLYLMDLDEARSLVHFIAVGSLVGAQGLLILG